MLEIDITKKNPMLSFMVGAGIAYFTYYFICVVKRPLLACNDTYRQFLLKYMPVTGSNFWPTFWCLETRAQTILRTFYKSLPEIKYERELLDTPDGGLIALDWTDCPNGPFKDNTSRPTVLILPGLTGSSAESYALHFVKEAKQQGYRSVVFNNRGNGGAELKTPRTYNATNTEDLTMVINHIRERYPKAPIIGVGVSLGGLILTNYLAKVGKNCGLVAGMTVSVPMDVFESAVSLEQPLNRFIFNRFLTQNLVENIRRHEHMFKETTGVNLDLVYQSKTVREFDQRFTSKMFGYKTNDDYYVEACIHEKLDLIEVPLLCLNAADDVFSPVHDGGAPCRFAQEPQEIRSRDTPDTDSADPAFNRYSHSGQSRPIFAIPIQNAQNSRYVCIMVTQHGGHIGFLEGVNPRGRSYMDRVYAQYISAMFQHGSELKNML